MKRIEPQRVFISFPTTVKKYALFSVLFVPISCVILKYQINVSLFYANNLHYLYEKIWLKKIPSAVLSAKRWSSIRETDNMFIIFHIITYDMVRFFFHSTEYIFFNTNFLHKSFVLEVTIRWYQNVFFIELTYVCIYLSINKKRSRRNNLKNILIQNPHKSRFKYDLNHLEWRNI